MPVRYVFANFIATELEEGISAGVLEMKIPPSIAALLPEFEEADDDEMRLVLWDGQQAPEIVGVVANPQTGILTITRGEEDTTGKAWNAGTQVRCALTAEIINAALAAYFDINDVLDANFLPLTGGTLTGALTLSGAPTDNLHAATKAYADTIGTGKLATSGGTMTGAINMNSNRILSLPEPISNSEPATKSYVDAEVETLTNFNTDDTAIGTAGSAAAYTVVSATDYDALTDGIRLTIVPHVTNDIDATFSLDGLTAKELRVKVGEGLPPGLLEAGVPIRVTYKLSDDCWYIHGMASSVTAVRVGDYKWSDIDEDHDRWLLCDGRAVSRSTYARLFSQLGIKYGSGDGSTTFNLPNGAGRTLVGRDDMGGTAQNVIQKSTTITTTSANTSATVGSATGLAIGMYVITANVPAGAQITNISGTTITMSQAATATAGPTAARFSPFLDPEDTGSTGGTLTTQLVSQQMPAHTHTANVTDPGHNHSGATSEVQTGSGSQRWINDPAAGTVFTNNSTTGITVSNTNTGGDGNHLNTQPGLIANLFVYS